MKTIEELRAEVAAAKERDQIERDKRAAKKAQEAATEAAYQERVRTFLASQAQDPRKA